MKLKSIIVVILLVLATNIAYSKEGFIEGFAKGIVKGMANEAGERIMDTILNGKNTGIQGDNNDRKVNNSWFSDRSHPVYENVISTSNRGEWKPVNGYIWQNPHDINDWGVIKIHEHKKITTNSFNHESIYYDVVYKGRDGVNVRSAAKVSI